MSTPRLILADDDPDFRALMTDVLAQAGYEVLPATDGLEALRLCETHAVAAAVLDLVMPGKEGLETIFEMRRRFPRIRIVAISGGGRGRAGDYLQMARQLGADAALAKPFASAEIIEAIRSVLSPSAPSAPPTAP